jgi:ribosomal protein L20A (L18A)
LLLFVVLAYESRGVELPLRGLNIERLLPPDAPNLGTAVLADATHLDGMLGSLTFPEAIIDEEVPTFLTEEPTEHSDTDESIEIEEEKRGDGKELNYSKFTSRYGEDRSKIRLRPSEIDQSQRPNQITEDLCRRLAKDAFCIANAHPNARTRDATTPSQSAQRM